MTGLRLGYDAHGNPESKAFDLGGMDDDRVRGEKILLYICSISDATWDEAALAGAVAERGFQMDFMYQMSADRLTERALSDYGQLWYISTSTPTLDTSQVDMIAGYVRRGNGLAIWADNVPFYADANLLAKAITGATFSGNRQAERIMTPAERLSPGHFIDHPLTQGVNSLYEGHTICTIEIAPGVTLLGQSHDGQMSIGAFERDDQRVVLDTGFTKLYSQWFRETAGTARYLRNIAFWLARGSRGVEYRLMTQARQGMATIASGQTSHAYTQTVTEPVMLTYALQWEGGATLGLQVRDPSGTVVFDQTSASAPLRATLPARETGDWAGYVRGAQVSGQPAPYVLAVSLDRKRALPLPPIQPSPPTATATPQEAPPFVPIYLLVDGSAAAASLAPALSDGVARLARLLSARALPRVGVKLAVVGTGGDGGLLAPLAPPNEVGAPRIAMQGASQLGAALRTLLADLPLRTARARPLIVALLAGPPADIWASHADQLHTLASNMAARVVVIGLNGYADTATLGRLAPAPPLSAPNLTPPRAAELFDWLYALADWAIGQYEGHGGAPQPQPPAWVETLR